MPHQRLDDALRELRVTALGRLAGRLGIHFESAALTQAVGRLRNDEILDLLAQIQQRVPVIQREAGPESQVILQGAGPASPEAERSPPPRNIFVRLRGFILGR